MKAFKKVAVGGTFDELHRGHKTLLLKAYEIGDCVLVGLSSDELVSKLNKPHITASYAERLQGLKDFLDDLGLLERTEVVPLTDAYGSSVKDPNIQALVVSPETMPNAVRINKRREKAGLTLLKIVSINMVPSENCGPISTTRIRKGEMDREGRLIKAASRSYS